MLCCMVVMALVFLLLCSLVELTHNTPHLQPTFLCIGCQSACPVPFGKRVAVIAYTGHRVHDSTLVLSWQQRNNCANRNKNNAATLFAQLLGGGSQLVHHGSHKISCGGLPTLISCAQLRVLQSRTARNHQGRNKDQAERALTERTW